MCLKDIMLNLLDLFLRLLFPVWMLLFINHSFRGIALRILHHDMVAFFPDLDAWVDASVMFLLVHVIVRDGRELFLCCAAMIVVFESSKQIFEAAVGVAVGWCFVFSCRILAVFGILTQQPASQTRHTGFVAVRIGQLRVLCCGNS